MIYFYYGEDSYRAKETIDQLKKKFIELYDAAGHNVEIIDGEEFSLERFFTAVKASGFLAPKKFIVIKNVFSFRKFADVQDDIIAYLKTLDNTNKENYLVFWHEGMPKKSKLFAYLVKRCAAQCCKNFEELEHPKLIAWTQKQASRHHKKLTKDAAELLISLVGDSTWHVHHALEKLCHATDAESIGMELVTELISTTQVGTIFPLMDAMSAKKKAEALKLLEEHFRFQTDRQYLVGMMVRQFRLLLYTKEASTATHNSYAIAERLKLHPYVAKKMLEHSVLFQKKELERIYGHLIALDGILKSDPSMLDSALTLFIARL